MLAIDEFGERGQPALGISHHALRLSGGFERYALALVQGLHDRGIRPTFLARSFDARLAELAWVDPVRLATTGVPGKWCDLWFDWRIGRARRRLAARLDVLIACNPTRWADIAVCGGTHPGYLRAIGRRPTLGDRWKVGLERACFESARVIVAHSGLLRREIIALHGIAPAKVRLLYPPTDTTRFQPVSPARRQALRSALGLPDDRAVFLLASTAHKRKGLAALADVFGRTHLPATLVVAGRPPEVRLPNVRYLGYRTDMEDVYRAVDFTVMPSTYEPFGLVGVESVLCGTPVLLAEGVGCAEVIAEPAALVYPPAAPGALEHTVRLAVERWRSGTHRLDQPFSALRYDPRISVHVDALLALAWPEEAARALDRSSVQASERFPDRPTDRPLPP